MPRPNWLPWAMAAPAPPADHRAANCAGDLPELQPRILRLRRVRRAVAQQDVRQLVRHHASDFAFRRRRVEHAPLNEHRPARERERVDLLQVHRRERVPIHRLVQFRRRRSHQSIAERREISGDRGSS